jgi:tRNA-dihydrouridine synthase B
MGASMAVSEMITSDPRQNNSPKTLRRLNQRGEPAPRVVQIVGSDPDRMARAACLHVEHGAHIIDVNMGCPAKKVCNSMAGSALLKYPARVAKILEAVVAAIEAPVTLKIRTGPDPQHRNGLEIARIAENIGIQCIAVHGRTRACGYKGKAEYDTIRRIKQAATIPIIANGDIDSPSKARKVLATTGADAIMIGRAAQGQPWLFREIDHYLKTGKPPQKPTMMEVRDIMLEHLDNLYSHYSKKTGVFIARKHINWYLRQTANNIAFRHKINQVEDSRQQFHLVSEYFEEHTTS